MLRGRRIVDDSSDDEFPDIKDLAFKPKKTENRNVIGTPAAQTKESSAKNGTVRRRKLGAVVVDNPLLRPLSGDRTAPATILPDKERENYVPRKKQGSTTPQRVELRTRKTRPIITSVELDEGHCSDETGSVQEESILEDFSELDDDDASAFEASEDDDDFSDDNDFELKLMSRSPSKTRRAGGGNLSERDSAGGRTKKRSPSPGAQLLAEFMQAREREQKPTSLDGRKASKVKNDVSRKGNPSSALANPLSKLRIHDLPPPTKSRNPSEDIERPGTPPSPPSEPTNKGLISPSKKIPRIPTTPHRPHMDTFWDQEFIDEWNDEHSPKKQLFLPSATTAKPQTNSPAKKSDFSSPKKSKTSEAAAQRAAKKAFTQAKHEVAEKFLKELDERITDNKLSELATSTGGIRIEWSNKLNTTAGRANWKRETIRSKTEVGNDTTAMETRHRHHAWIELAEKVIDDEHRLLNVIAHEFCHLANFMVTGITNNPHGKEFKAWAAKVTRVFGESRGIEVTTKHSYDIDFKYVWECTACGIEFKRHSKSIQTDRHRCGSCKGELKQTKPVPRKNGAGAATAGGEGAKEVKKESEYQRFMKEQMKLIKAENPRCPQKDIMRQVAARWAVKKAGGPETASSNKDGGGDGSQLDGVAKEMNKLTIIDLT